MLDLARNTSPAVESTWDLPATSTSFSVASLLPTGVSLDTLPASNPPDIAFRVDISTVPINRRVGNDCAQCEVLHGTNAFKPQFILQAGNTQGLPQDMVSGTVLSGTITVTLTNNMSFDPLFVRTGPPPQQQGFMLLVVRSGSLVLGRDSVNGATTPFPAGGVLTRTIAMSTGTVTNGLSVDVTLNSPSGDHNEFIDADGTLSANASLRDVVTNQPTLRVGSVTMNVVNRTMTSATGDTLALDELDSGIADKVVAATLRMTITNPFDVSGTVDIRFGYGPLPSDGVTKQLSMTSGVAQVQTVQLSQADIQSLLGQRVGLSIAGDVNSASPITVTPGQIVSVDNRLVLLVRLGGD